MSKTHSVMLFSLVNSFVDNRYALCIASANRQGYCHSL
nr:MAG TPA: DNA-directed RNA polymerase [Caudoviricetes sp.]